MSVFRFKQFSVNHNRSTMKVGTDAVLLGAWTPIVKDCKQILEIGCGCGVISLMLAQRSLAIITGIDVDKSSVEEAIQNADNSSWAKRIIFQHISAQEFCSPENKQRFDLIVSNPPFFENSLKSPFEKRNLSRHTDTLSLEELAFSVDYCLSETGYFAIILPVVNSGKIMKLCKRHNLFCNNILNIQPFSSKPINRLILFFSHQKHTLKTENLSIRSLNGNYSEDYKQLTKDFYLQF